MFIRIGKKPLSLKVYKFYYIYYLILEDISEQDRIAYSKEREEVEKQVREHMENMERINKENLIKKKSHQNDLVYQIGEKEKLKCKENHDKLLDERTTKILEADYMRKIEQYKYNQYKKVIFNFFKKSNFK
jgi:hypothetical protein